MIANNDIFFLFTILWPILKNILFVPYNNRMGTNDILVVRCSEMFGRNGIFGFSLIRYDGDK